MIVPAYTFFATSATVVAANAIPVIVDVDDSLCLDPAAVEKAITKRTKAIVPVHMRGAPAQMDAIMDVAKRKGIPVIEDVAQAGGGSFRGQPLGSIGTLGCFSFDYYKVIVSGEGGFVTTNDEWLYTRAQNWHDCAACWRPDRFARESKDGELFCGENYRMSELEGAVALAQIRKAGKTLAGYRRAFRRIQNAIELRPGMSFRRVADPEGDTGICLTMFMPQADHARQAIPAMQAEGVPAGGIYDSKVRDWHIFSYWETHPRLQGGRPRRPAVERRAQGRTPQIHQGDVSAHPRPALQGGHARDQLQLLRRRLRRHRHRHQQSPPYPRSLNTAQVGNPLLRKGGSQTLRQTCLLP